MAATKSWNVPGPIGVQTHQVQGRELEPMLVQLKSLLSPCSREIQTPHMDQISIYHRRRTDVQSHRRV